MFGRGSIFLRAFLLLILIGVFIAGGVMLFQSGQAQGYAMGQAAALADGDDGLTAPPANPQGAPFYRGYGPGFGYWRPHFFFFPFGLFFFILFFFLIGGLWRGIFWRRGYGHGPWHEGPHGEHIHPHTHGAPSGERGESKPGETNEPGK